MPHIPRAVCASCEQPCQPFKVGAVIEFLRKVGDEQKPYFKVIGDIWICIKCSTQTVVGWGAEPVAEHFQDTYENWKADIAIPDVRGH